MNKIIYLDAAASAQKPDAVINAQTAFLCDGYANAGRGICARAAAVDDMVAAARSRVAQFINANPDQVVFTSGATDGLNRVVNIIKNMPQYVECVTVAVSDLDHHSARLPWEYQTEFQLSWAQIVPMELDQNMDIDIDRVPCADVMVITAMSNVMGTPQDVAAIVRAARAKNPHVITIVDAAQYAAHHTIDVREWDCDFMCLSGHKIGADTGVGIMYIKKPNRFLPDKLGGGMVNVVRGIGDFSFNPPPEKFEAGTLPLTQIAGIVPAIDYMVAHPVPRELVEYMYDRLRDMPRVRLLTRRDASLISFTVDGMHVLDFGALIGAHGVCLRVGNMCATWIHRALDIPGSIRISPGPWNTMDEMRRVADIIEKMVK